MTASKKMTLLESVARADEIRVLIKEGCSVNDLARRYGLSRVSMARFLKTHALKTQQQQAYAAQKEAASE
jgi:lambda repressor-like predicted transcriptional regulator